MAKQIKFFKSLLTVVVMTTLLFACNDDDDHKGPANQFVFEGTTRSLKTGFLRLSSDSRIDHDQNTVYDHNVTLLSDGIMLDGSGELTGSGHGINFRLANPSASTLAVGSYTFTDTDDENGPAMTHYSSVVLTGFSTSGSDGLFHTITGGTLNVSKSGDTYTIEFEGTAVTVGIGSSNTITVYFSGTLAVIEE